MTSLRRGDPPDYRYVDRPLPGGTTKMDRQWSISTVDDRLREKSTVDDRLREKKGRRRRIPCVVLSRDSSSPARRCHPQVAREPSPPAGDFSPA
ncbi:hypothetical protein BHE74_00052518 [Ensete ventricosum]|nr:hypothetical protein BHE74_00052518 [Ensete ventricosum]